MYPAWDATPADVEPSEMTGFARKMWLYGVAQMAVIAGDETDTIRSDLDDLLEALTALAEHPEPDSVDGGINGSTASLLAASSDPELRAVALTAVERILAATTAPPFTPTSLEGLTELQPLTRTRVWADFDPGLAPVPCEVAGAAVRADDPDVGRFGPLEPLGAVVLADPSVAERCGELDTVQLVPELDPLEPAMAEVVALHEAGLVGDADYTSYVKALREGAAEVGGRDPWLLSYAIAIGALEPMPDEVHRARAEAIGAATQRTIVGPDPVELWLLADLARLTGVELPLHAEAAVNGLPATEALVFDIASGEAGSVGVLPGRSSLGPWAWLAALDALELGVPCDRLDDLRLDRSPVIVVEVLEHLETTCGFDFRAAPAQDPVHANEGAGLESLGLDSPTVVLDAVLRASRCRLGLPAGDELEAPRDYPADLEELWAVAVLTSPC